MLLHCLSSFEILAQNKSISKEIYLPIVHVLDFPPFPISTGLKYKLQVRAQFRRVFTPTVSLHEPYMTSAGCLQLTAEFHHYLGIYANELGVRRLSKIFFRLSPTRVKQAALIVFMYMIYRVYI